MRASLTVVLLFLTPLAAAAEEAEPLRLPEVLVTVRKWVEDSRDVPRSVTQISAEGLRDAGIRSVREASLFVPNLNIVEFSSRRLSFPFVRGIGSGQGDPAVATYIDGVPQLSIGSTNLPLLDVERIEFLRGPQATLYGRNALGGLIHVITKRPGNFPELGFEGTLGNHGLREARFAGSQPIAEDRLFVGVAGLVTRRDGFVTNDFTGHHVDERDTLYGRAQVVFTPDDENEFRLSLHRERTRDGGFVLTDLDELRARPYRIDQDYEGVTERDVFAPSLTFRHLGESFEITAVSAFTDLDVFETSDFDFSTFDGVRRRADESLTSFSQEVRIASPEDAGFRWLAGVLWFTSDTERAAANIFRPASAGILTPVAGTDSDRGEFEDRGLGVFGQATVTLDDRLTLGVGLRYDRERKTADLDGSFRSGGATLSRTNRHLREDADEWLPRVDLSFRCSDEITAYGLAARGFKAGGFNLDAPEGRIAFGTETSWTYEIGVKTSFLDDRLRVNAALFHIDWKDMQLSQFDATVGGYVTNAGESTSRGFELEAQSRPLDGLDLFGSLGLTDATFDSHTDPYGEDVGGRNLPFAPKRTTSLGAQWSGEIDGDTRYFLRGEYTAIGSFHYDAGNRESESYALANFRAGVDGGSWRVAAWVRNAFGREYVPVAFQPNPMDASAFVGESGAPRTFGLTLTIDF